jgi:D-galactonate transporter
MDISAQQKLPATDIPIYSDSATDTVYRKITLRLIPFLFICYVAGYLDRINVGFAQLQMKHDLGFSDAVYGLGAGIFFAGYFLFEVPSNLLLARVGARKTLIRIMALWGLTSACMLFIRTPVIFYVLRFVLGACEAGFFPGMILYLTYWYPAKRRGRVMALFLTAVAMAGVIGGPLSGWVMNHMAGEHGMAGWQWLFLIEGLPSCVLGVIAYLYLDNDPADATWLTDREKEIVSDQLERDQRTPSLFRGRSFGSALKTPRVYTLAFAWFTFICGVYAISFWLPTMIKSAGIADPLSIGLFSAIPYGFAAITMVVVSRHSDGCVERRFHACACAVIGAIALSAITATGTNLTMALIVLSVATSAIFTLQPLFWAIATDSLGGTRAAAGTIATINSLGLLGGFVSPAILGWTKTMTGSLTNGLYVIATLLLLGAVVSLRFRATPPKSPV